MRIACYIRCDTVFNEVQAVLARAHFECERFQSEIPLLRRMRRQGFDLILVDTEGDPLDEKRIYSWLNCRTGETTPVVLLSSAYCARTITLSLEAGADDFINRPVEPDVLIARLQAVVRRSSRKTTRRVIEMLDFTLDKDACRLLDRGAPVELTPREFAMAWLLFSSPGIFLSRETISVAIWGVDCEIARHTIEQHVYKLRKKLNLCTERGVQIRTAYTKGYCLEICERVAMSA
jgi:DNA-binding response OmpR family regulator